MGLLRKVVLTLSQILMSYNLLGVSGEENSSGTITVTQPELQVLQESLNIISREIASMKSKYEANQAHLLSSIKALQTTVSQSDVRSNELKQKFTEHRSEVGNKFEDIKGVMIQDHAMLKTNSENVFNNMVDVMVEVHLQQRIQQDTLDEVHSVSRNLKSRNTNAICEDQEINCMECSDDRRLNSTLIFPETVVPNEIPIDVESLPPLPYAPDQVVPHPGDQSAAPPDHHPVIIPPPPPQSTSTTKPTTITVKTEAKKTECVSPFFRLKGTGECMVVSVTKRTWTDAQNSCLRIGAYLAVPEDPRVLHTYMRQAGSASYYYIGAHNKLGSFRWLDGTLVDRRHWRPHSPSTTYAGRLCVAYTLNGSGNKLLWANKATLCDTGLRYNFICEK